MKQKGGIIATSIVTLCFCFISLPVGAVDVTAPSSVYKTFGVDTIFNKESFYDKRIVEFSFVRGKWSLEFDRTTGAFKPVTDLLRVATNLPRHDISSEVYHLTMVKNTSRCLTNVGLGGSQDFVSVSVDVDGVFEPVTELGVDIGGSGLKFEKVDRTGLYSDHEVTLTFSPLNVGIDKQCYGTVGMHVELEI
ncbi:hypothetical protein HL669_23695 [Vibrio parahaemolyticus]|uniref:hypothetical protein n=1 Tax=Vibrio parahaemolyticus TaxID=670 RepID=UPI0014852FD3|nr:hypothetical protein [Vibrio parahaemolyticus]NNU14598.1 hypothetical protein [Vibrio parahaemolyticus]